MPERNCVLIPIDGLGLGMDVPAPKMRADTSFNSLRSRGKRKPMSSFVNIYKGGLASLG